MILTTRSFDADMKDIYCAPGTRLKQWVVALRARLDWERETCPYVDDVPVHKDDPGFECSNHGRVQLRILDDHECQACRDIAAANWERPDIAAYLAERERRARADSAIDRSLLSDEIQPDMSLRDHPMFSFLQGKR